MPRRYVVGNPGQRAWWRQQGRPLPYPLAFSLDTNTCLSVDMSTRSVLPEYDVVHRTGQKYQTHLVLIGQYHAVDSELQQVACLLYGPDCSRPER